MSTQEKMASIQLPDAVKSLQKLKDQRAASFGRQVAEASVGRKYRDVDYWRGQFTELLSSRAAIDSVDKPLVVRE